MKTRKFNLEEALAGKPVVTRDGKYKVTEIHKFNVSSRPIVAVVGDAILFYDIDGYRHDKDTLTVNDLRMAVKSVTKYAIYDKHTGEMLPYTFDVNDIALQVYFANDQRYHSILFEIEE